MIEKLEIEGYRGIAHGEISGLAPLTILVGPNSSGKSSVLEAAALISAPQSPAVAAYVAKRRGWVGEASAEAWLPTGNARLSAAFTGGGSTAIDFTRIGTPSSVQSSGGLMFSPSANYGRPADRKLPLLLEVEPANIEPERLNQAVSRANLLGARPQMLDLLRPVLPGIRDLRIETPWGDYALFIEDDSPKPWPATVAGDGLKRLLLLTAEIASDESGLILVEEPEVYLHVGALSQIAKVLWQAISSEKPKQIIATTHSLELIDALFTQEMGDLSKAVLFRMSLRKGKLKVVRVPGDAVRDLRQEIDEDLRK